MCIAIPMQVVEINGRYAVCKYENIKRVARIDLVENVNVGDYVLIHTGFVIQKLDINDAIETIKLYKEISSFDNTK